MPVPLRSEEAAMARLKALCAPSAEPALDDIELADILEGARLARVWEPGLAVTAGEYIVPATPNGWMYMVDIGRDSDGLAGGITGETEPRWPLDPRWPSWEPATVNDGTARFRITKREILGLWDIKAAAYTGWILKAAKASGEYASSLEGNSFHPEQVAQTCLQMAAKFVPVRVR